MRSTLLILNNSNILYQTILTRFRRVLNFPFWAVQGNLRVCLKHVESWASREHIQDQAIASSGDGELSYRRQVPSNAVAALMRATYPIGEPCRCALERIADIEPPNLPWEIEEAALLEEVVQREVDMVYDDVAQIGQVFEAANGVKRGGERGCDAVNLRLRGRRGKSESKVERDRSTEYIWERLHSLVVDG